MALKGYRDILRTDISNITSTTGERGNVWVYTTSGSGYALGSTSSYISIVANPSGYKVAGYGVDDVISIDETRYYRHDQKMEQKLGEPLSLAVNGWLVTDRIIGTPAVGDTAYLSSSGNVTPTLHSTGGLVATPKVGQFQSIKDENGFAKVAFNLPVV